jgi:hypothetical protein
MVSSALQIVAMPFAIAVMPVGAVLYGVGCAAVSVSSKLGAKRLKRKLKAFREVALCIAVAPGFITLDSPYLA